MVYLSHLKKLILRKTQRLISLLIAFNSYLKRKEEKSFMLLRENGKILWMKKFLMKFMSKEDI